MKQLLKQLPYVGTVVEFCYVLAMQNIDGK